MLSTVVGVSMKKKFIGKVVKYGGGRLHIEVSRKEFVPGEMVVLEKLLKSSA